MNVFKDIARLLSDGESIVVATVLDRLGPAPGTVGSRMVVRAAGQCLGTIGGGILEASVQALAKQIFKSRKTIVSKFTLTAKDASDLGMICGGQVRVLVGFIDSSDGFQRGFYRDLADALESGGQVLLVTRVPGEDGEFDLPGCGILRKDGSVFGSLDAGPVRGAAAAYSGKRPRVVRFGDDSFLVEPLGREGWVFIFGGGHIALELAPLAKLVGFRTAVLDDRREFACRERFPSADSVLVIDSFENALDGLNVNEDSFLVVVTRGHEHDKTVLGRALATKAGYIGMIGSRAKREATYNALIAEGVSRTELERVHCPIGLNIGAETPEEIAVSIVGELIQARAGKI